MIYQFILQFKVQLITVYLKYCLYPCDSLPSQVTDTRTADCTVLEYPKTCPVESLNTYNCSKYIWTGLVEVSSSTIRLSEIIVSSEEVVLEHMNLTLANFSLPISVR